MTDDSFTQIWAPAPEDLQHSNVAKFINFINRKHGLGIVNYHQLHEFSVNPRTNTLFWLDAFEFLELGESTGPTEALVNHGGRMFPSPRFFPEARLNFAGTIFMKRNPNRVIISEVEEGTLQVKTHTWGALFSQVEEIAAALVTAGVKQGDRVAAVISNNEFAVALSLATLSIGGIWSSISPDFGPQGVLDRLTQITPRIVFCETTVNYSGKGKDLVANTRVWSEALARQPSLVNVVVLPPCSVEDLRSIAVGISFESFLASRRPRPMSFVQLPFDAPAFIVYSSGTTGPPKCILHSAGGVLLQAKKDFALHLDVRESDTYFQYTTTSWIMWVFVLCNVGLASNVVLYAGSPFYPDMGVLPRIIQKLRVSVFGTSARYLTELMDKNQSPKTQFDLSSLRKVSSTGSVLTADVARWFYNKGFPTNVQLLSCTGGTDCACTILHASPLLPVYAGEIACKTLGMAADVFTSEGASVATAEETGELVCTQPFPSEPLKFWGKNGLEKYRKAYYEMFGPSIWAQGDLVQPTKHAGFAMLGRSDGVLNPSGVRFGSAEIYNVTRRFQNEIEDALCVGQRRPQDKDETVILFVKLHPNLAESKSLKTRLLAQIEKDLSRRHVPKYVFYVPSIPYTVNGKKMETLIRDIVSGKGVKTHVVENPESVLAFKKYYWVEQEAAKQAQLDSKL
ncbi:hypothetical protein NM208_g571 [Fusarium decemcellulare]|uniref:Uncharacterized protein n=2 Tax=Fusarium decemcellulare TaxID=57161 RepID=A0ACC1SYM5_9HYPO|nr:hypothetical protein NM208_g742 [Fusarium decemcellulare]KAJ3549301.1 hypothetical protein NM208_g571 [Fusarium decemcellulare]